MVTNEVAVRVMFPSELGPISEKDKETASNLLGGLPSGVDIAAALIARHFTETVAMPVFNEAYQPGSYNNFVMSGF
jgi:hypothetical protein